MPISLTMPALSPTMTEGKLAKWNVKEGDKVTSGTVLAEIETDKATMEFEAIDDGTVGKLLVPEGTEGIAVNAPIAVLLADGEDASALQGFTPKATGGASAPAAPPASTPAPPKPTASAVPPAQPVAPAPAQPVAPAPAQPVAPAPPAPRAAEPHSDGARIFASPLARRLAAQANIDLGAVNGSGPHGRIVKADIEAAQAGGVTRPTAAAAPAAKPDAAKPIAPSVPLAPPAGDFIELPLSMMRKTIARRLTESKQTIPHFYLTVDCELDALLALRQQINAKSDAYKLSVNDFIIRACGMALRQVPTANAIWGGDKLLQSRSYDVAVAVALDGGLITPIIKDADHKGLASISSEMKELAGRAKLGKLRPEEYQGGTFSLSNLGMYGIKEFAAVINPPHGSILAVGAGEQRPVVKKGALAVATVMSCTLACDHRVIDGALGAKWLAAFKGFIEDPLTMLL